MHAEHLSYLKLMKKLSLFGRHLKKTKYDLMVLRFTKTGTLGYSRPCKECLMRLRKSNIRINNVYYSESIQNEQLISVEKFSSMANSSLTKSSGGTIRNRNYHSQK